MQDVHAVAFVQRGFGVVVQPKSGRFGDDRRRGRARRSGGGDRGDRRARQRGWGFYLRLDFRLLFLTLPCIRSQRFELVERLFHFDLFFQGLHLVVQLGHVSLVLRQLFLLGFGQASRVVARSGVYFQRNLARRHAVFPKRDVRRRENLLADLVRVRLVESDGFRDRSLHDAECGFDKRRQHNKIVRQIPHGYGFVPPRRVELE